MKPAGAERHRRSLKGEGAGADESNSETLNGAAGGERHGRSRPKADRKSEWRELNGDRSEVRLADREFEIRRLRYGKKLGVRKLQN